MENWKSLFLSTAVWLHLQHFEKSPLLCPDGQFCLRICVTHALSEAKKHSASRLVTQNRPQAATGAPPKLCSTHGESSGSGHAAAANWPPDVMPFIHQWRHQLCLITLMSNWKEEDSLIPSPLCSVWLCTWRFFHEHIWNKVLFVKWYQANRNTPITHCMKTIDR